MSEYGATKRLCQNEWPALFDITPLVKLIFKFVPKMQIRQWVRQSSGKLQYDICSWMPKEDIDTEIHKAIIVSDNQLCVQYLPSPSAIYKLVREKNTAKQDLSIPHILSVLPFSDVFANEAAPLCNLKALAKHKQWTQTRAIYLIQFGCSFQTKEWFAFLLSLVDNTVEIGNRFEPVFNLDTWTTFHSFIESGQCTIETADIDFFADMPLDEFQSISKSVYQKMCKDEVLIVACIQQLNWDVANYLWTNDFSSLDLKSTFDRCIGTNVDQSMHCASVVTDDSEFSCLRTWDRRPLCKKNSAGALNSALRFVHHPFVNGSRATFRDALSTWISGMFLSHDIAFMTRVFEQACIFGHYYTIRAIWNFVSHSEEQQQSMRDKLDGCRFCDDLETLEFAWSIIRDDIRKNALKWVRSAYNKDNRVLWKFICDKQLLDLRILFDDTIHIAHNTLDFKADNIAQSLGRKSVDFITPLWAVQEMQNTNNVDNIFYEAIIVWNEDVLRFLNDNHAQLSQHAISKYLLTICNLKLFNLLSQFTHTSEIPIDWLHNYYQFAPEADRELLWHIQPLPSTIHFLQNATLLSFDMSIFLLHKQAMSTQVCIDTLTNRQDVDNDLINEIQAYTYCEVDTVQRF